MFFKEELKKYVITIYKCNKSKLSEQWFFFNLIKIECVYTHTDSFNLKEFNIANQQLISLHWLETHMTI